MEIAGSTVARATLHNPEEILRKRVKIGDQVIIRKAGDIIPEILEPIEKLREGTEKDIVFPKNCPECETPIDFSEIVPRCLNTECSGAHRQRLFYFADTLKIDGLGKKTIEYLLDLELIHTPADLWKLNQFDLALLPNFKHKKIFNLLNSLETKKRMELWEIFAGLGIRMIGKENAKIFAHYFRDKFHSPSIKSFNQIIKRNFSIESFSNIDGIGKKVAEQFLNYLEKASTKKLFGTFETIGLEIYWPKIRTKNLKFLDKTFLITGSFENFSRDELKKIITDEGGKILSAVSKNLSILCAGNKPGSKLKKIETFNEILDIKIEIWNESQILKKCEIKSSTTSKTQNSLF